MKKYLFMIIFGVLHFLISACSSEVTEVERLSNSEKSIDIVVALREVGATVATPMEIFLVLKGVAVNGQPIFRADKVEGLEVAWISTGEILIKARQARVFINDGDASVVINGDKRVVNVKYDIDRQL